MADKICHLSVLTGTVPQSLIVKQWHAVRSRAALRTYLRAALRQPPLFYLPAATAAANIESVVQRFRPHGLTHAHHLGAALKHPRLFCQRPATVIANIEAVTDHFRPHGLTLATYLRCAGRRPQLFCQRPATVIANIEAVTGHFRPNGS